MRSVLIGLLLSIGLWPASAPVHAAQSLASGSGGAAADTRSDSAPSADGVFDPRTVFAPITLPEGASRTRSANGAPGPDYWQNRADYVISARLEPKSKTLSAVATIAYTNNSPDALDVLWLQLDQNIYRRDSRAAVAGGRARTQFTDGDVLDSVAIETGGKFVAAKYLVSDTRLQVRLPTVLPGAGGRIRLRINYHYTLPGAFGGRTQWTDTPNGEIYDVAQWYPRMAVYDDVRGWDTLPYLGDEFYLEYGDFDYAITVPADMIVAGSGALMNPQDVLTSTQAARLTAARASDKTVMIRTAEDVAAAQPSGGTKTDATKTDSTKTDSTKTDATKTDSTKTWRFRIEHARDVAFAASRAFVWDAARVNLPDGKTALAQSFYPVESAGDAAWGRSTEYLKFAIEEFSRLWFPYPWPNAINVGGPVGGMEYPAVVFESSASKGRNLFWITVHEIGHTYFPMVVGSNERRHAWMDEGLNTFIDIHESDAFEGGVYGPKHDQEFAPGEGAPADQIAALIADPNAPPIMTPAASIPAAYSHPVSYFKTAYGLVLLRDVILGPERFDAAFRKFIRDWAYKHPQPSDFFRAMSSEGGEDLSWFWRGWFLHNWALDLALDGVTYVEGDPAKGASIAVSNRGQLVLPATMRITFKDGTTSDVTIPVETWMQSGSHTFTVDARAPIASVVIDPDRRLPQRDRSHAVWSAP